MKREYESEMMQVLHEELMDLHRSGFISDARMREFEEICFSDENEIVYSEDDEADLEAEDSPEEEEETTTT
jgi:DNA-binding transcriptional regulator YiaG